MNNILRCNNPDCDEPSGLFLVTLAVDAHREPGENVYKLEAEYFKCMECGEEAEED